MKIDYIVDRMTRYIEEKMFPTMLNWQRVACRTFMNRIKHKPILFNSVIPFLGFFEYSDEHGHIDVDELIDNLREAVSTEGKLEISIPMLGLKYNLSPSDIEELGWFLKSNH